MSIWTRRNWSAFGLALLLSSAVVVAVVVTVRAHRRPPAARPAVKTAPAAHEEAHVASRQVWQRRWTWPAGAPLLGGPVPADEGWAVTTQDGCAMLLESNGHMRWSHTFTTPPGGGPPVLAGDVVIVAGADGQIAALAATTGEPRWQTSRPGVFRRTPLALKQGGEWRVVLLSASDGALFCLAARDGRNVWRTEPTNRSDGAPATDGFQIAYGNCDAAVHVFDAATGARVARVAVGEGAEMAGGVLCRDKRVYGGTRSGELVCVDAAADKVAWRKPIGSGEAFVTPVGAERLVVAGAADGTIAALDAVSGAELWRVSLGAPVAAMTVLDDALFAVAGGALHGRRLADGTAFAHLAIGDDVSGPTCNGHLLAVADDGGNVVVLGPAPAAAGAASF